MKSRSVRCNESHLNATSYHRYQGRLSTDESSDPHKQASFIQKSYSFRKMIGLGPNNNSKHIRQRGNSSCGSPGDAEDYLSNASTPRRSQLSPYAHYGYCSQSNQDTFRHYKPLSFAFLGQIYGASAAKSSSNQNATEHYELEVRNQQEATTSISPRHSNNNLSPPVSIVIIEQD